MELNQELEDTSEPLPVPIYPNLGERYHAEMARLGDMLNQEGYRTETAENICMLIKL